MPSARLAVTREEFTDVTRTIDQTTRTLKSHQAGCEKENRKTQAAIDGLTSSVDGLTNSFEGMSKTVDGLGVTVGTMGTTQEGMQTTVDGLKDIVDNGKKLFWRAVGAIVLAILGAAATVMIQNWNIKQSVATKAEVEAKTASRYTQEDARRDRDLQDQRMNAIIQEIRRRHP